MLRRNATFVIPHRSTPEKQQNSLLQISCCAACESKSGAEEIPQLLSTNNFVKTKGKMRMHVCWGSPNLSYVVYTITPLFLYSENLGEQKMSP